MSITCNHSIYGYCENCVGDLYEKALKHSGGHDEAHDEPIPQVAVPEVAHAAQRAACEEQRQGARDALLVASNEDGAQGSGEAHSPERIVLDVATLRYVIECLELQARQCSTSRRSPVAAKLRSMADNWRRLISDCATTEANAELRDVLQQFVNGVETRMIDSPADETLANITWRAKVALASADTHAERRDVEQARPVRVGSAVAKPDAQTVPVPSSRERK